MKRNFRRQIFLENLPHKYGVGNNINKLIIDWKSSIGYKIRFIYGDIEEYFEIVEYEPKGQKVKIRYNNNEKYIQTNSVLNCKLGIVLGKITKDYKYEIGQRIQDDKRDITIVDRKKEKDKNGQEWKYYKYDCNICGFDGGKHYSIKDKKYKEELWILEGGLESKKGCSCCCNPSQIVVEHINSIIATDTWMIPIINDLEFCKTHTHRTEDYCYVTCQSCGQVSKKKMSASHIDKKHAISCKKCGDGISYPNKFAFNLLKQLGVDFIPEYSPDWIKPRAYDFYFKLNNKEYILEMDGGLGHGNKMHKNSKLTLKETVEIDSYKDKKAIEQGIEKPIRIDCNYENNNRFEYIKQNILKNKELNKLFDLSNIDWNKCEESILSNLVKVVCDYWDSGVHSTSKIANITKLSLSVVRSYLHIGTKLNWCNYDSKKELRKNGSRNGKLTGKQVEIFKDGVSLGIFESCHELERQSEKLFRVKLGFSMISQVCNGNRKQYKGFIFKYKIK